MVNCVSCDKEGEEWKGRKRKGRRGTSSLVEEQLNVLFFIQNLLDVPQDIVNPTELIERDGDPSGWIHFCGKCLEWVEEGKEAYRNIIHFENVLEKCKKKVEERIRNTWKGLKDEDEIFFNVAAAVRHAVASGQRQNNNREEEQKKHVKQEGGMEEDPLRIDQQAKDVTSNSPSNAVDIEPEGANDFDIGDSFGCHIHEDMGISICPVEGNVIEENRSHRVPPIPVSTRNMNSQSSCAIFPIMEDSMELEEPFPEDATICPVCLLEFQNTGHLRTHHTLHHTDKSSGKTCPVCGKSFQFPGVMRKHYNAVHRKKIVANCVKCGKGFAYKSMLDAHQCLADFVTPTVNAANTNNSNEEDQSLSSLHKCPFCPDLLTTQRFLERHVLTFHKSWDCQICGEKFSRSIDYCNHVKDHLDDESREKYLAGEKIFVLRKYDGQIKVLSEVEQQGKGGTNNPDGTIIELQYECKSSKEKIMESQKRCSICNKEFENAAKLRHHLTKEHNGATARQKVQCDECGAQVNKTHLRGHKQRVHAPPSDRLLCPLCGKSYKEKLSLDRHFRINHSPDADREKCKCPCCGKGFPTNCHLRRHQKHKNHYSSGEHQQ